jgi:cystathionine beta-lyase/cystathionine gamma-synthase
VSTPAQRIAARVLASRLTLGPAREDAKATASLRGMKNLPARNRGDFESAVISAAYYAKKHNQTMFVYPGNSYGHGVWRVTFKASEYLDPISNTGTKIASVTTELTFFWHDLHRPGL